MKPFVEPKVEVIKTSEAPKEENKEEVTAVVEISNSQEASETTPETDTPKEELKLSFEEEPENEA